MRNLNVDPFWRMSISFDRLHAMIDESLRAGSEEQYPPYNIQRTGEDSYRIALAVAGFKPEQLSITAQQDQLMVVGQSEEGKDEGEYLYRGIAGRSFQRRFNLADYVEVRSAALEDGILKIELERRIPEPMKPRKVEISNLAAAPHGESVKSIAPGKAA